MKTALRKINGCVALISLQTRRDDYKVKTGKGKCRYIVPPWLTAEEMYAWSAPRRPLVLRLKDVAVHDSTFNRNIWEATYDPKKRRGYEAAVDRVISKLNEFVNAEDFDSLRVNARRAQYDDFFPPPQV